MKILTGVAVAALVASVTACSGSDIPTPAGPTTTTAAGSATTTTSTPTPTETHATENQVASVIAGYEKGWRKAIDGAGNCRIMWMETSPDPLTDAQRTTCYAEEVTAGTSAKNALRDLDALSIPPSLEPLVDETKRSLTSLADVDLETHCGPSFQDIKQTPECDKALGAAMTAYFTLGGALDKWGPYTK